MSARPRPDGARSRPDDVPVRLLPRLFGSGSSRRERWVYGAVTLYFFAVAAAMMWPIYPRFAGVRPMILGMPLSLAYLGGLLVLSFAVALGLFVWEARRGVFDDEREGS